MNMVKKFSIYSIHVSFLLLKTTSSFLKPEYSANRVEKVLNTENVVLSLGDDDDTNSNLEIIKDHTDSRKLEKKLYEFHKYINLAEKTERPREKIFKPYSDFGFPPISQISYPDSPYEIAADEKHLSMLERRLWMRNKRKKLVDGKCRKHGRRKEKPSFPDVEDVEAEYEYMEKQYMDYVEKSKVNNVAYKYSDEGKPEESVKDVIYKIIDLKTPENCTNMTGIGIQKIECIIKNYQDGVFDKKEMIQQISIIVLIWFGIYLAIALPLWCSKGWCCCCCRCAFCFPNKTVREIQTYITKNPPGVLKISRCKEERYNPTQRETELYETIKKSIAEF